MPRSLWLSTRKGLFQLVRQNHGEWNIERVSFLGENISMFFPDDRDGSLYASLNLGHFGPKVRRSHDHGATWNDIAVPAFPTAEDGSGKSLLQVWSMEAAGPRASDGIWAGAIPAGLFFSGNRGDSWELNRPLWDLPDRPKWFGGGYVDAGIHSICVDPRDARHILIAISCAGVRRSTDGGATWEVASQGMFAEYMPPEARFDPNIQDPHRMVRCASQPDTLWAQHHNGIFRTVDNAAQWTCVEGMAPSSFGFAVAVHPHDGKRAWFVPAIKDECRVPVDARFVVSRTNDGGRSSEALREGLPAGPSYDLVYRHALDVCNEGKLLAVGSTTGQLFLSANGGDTWTRHPANFPPIYAVRISKE